MTSTLIGQHYPVEKRTGALGWVIGIAQVVIPGIIGIPLIGFVAGVGGWRFPWLVIAFPLSLLSSIMIARTVPTSSTHRRSGASRSVLVGYKTVFSNRTSIACLVSVALSNAAWQFFMTYGVAFMRQRFSLTLDQVTIYMVGLSALAFLGSIAASRLVKRYGRKRTTVLAILVTSLFVVAHYTVPVLWISIACALVFMVSGAIVGVAQMSLALEQAPDARGTMMAMTSAVISVGGIIGAGVGGVILSALASYSLVGVASLAIGLVAAVIFHRFVVDPTRR
jgi:predicted MFS family arabinose efflux permease